MADNATAVFKERKMHRIDHRADIRIASIDCFHQSFLGHLPTGNGGFLLGDFLQMLVYTILVTLVVTRMVERDFLTP